MTDEEIKAINDEFYKQTNNYEQGIYKEPFGIPNDVKEPVLYMRWETGGVSGGSCWDSSDPRPYRNDTSEKPAFIILDFVLKRLCPGISYLEYKEIEGMIRSSDQTDWEYYGNCTDWEITYLKVSDLERILLNKIE